jgi:arsenite-transporting ATPase
VDAAIVNRVLPDDASGGDFFERYRAAQQEYLDEIEHSFGALPILQVPHLGHEVFGTDLLDQLGEGMYAGRDPADVFYDEPTYRVRSENGAYTIDIRLPFTDAEDVTAQQFGDELVVQVKNQRRNYALPNFISYYTLTYSELADGWLHAHFEPGAEQ